MTTPYEPPPRAIRPVKAKRVVFRYATEEEWNYKNPILLAGEPGVVSENGLMKIGDGETGWKELPYINLPPEDTGWEYVLSELDYHIYDPRPHPAYDEGPSLKLLYENKKV